MLFLPGNSIHGPNSPLDLATLQLAWSEILTAAAHMSSVRTKNYQEEREAVALPDHSLS